MTDNTATEDDQRRYRAPALEKGLDILELLADAPHPLTFTAIANQLGRSHGELFRMAQVLQFRGYLAQDPANDGYYLTDRLFALGMKQPRTQNLIEAALPAMRQLSMAIGQSCHLAMHSYGEMVVVARMESSEQLGFSVRVGHRRPLHRAASGIVLYAFQPEDERRRWEALFRPTMDEAAVAELRDKAERVRAAGINITPSQFVAGVTDISVPVMRGNSAAAALTVPYLKKIAAGLSPRRTADLVRAASRTIADQLMEADSRL